jgi:hypothetical protein
LSATHNRYSRCTGNFITHAAIEYDQAIE